MTAFIKKYIEYFNEARPAYSLMYLTPKEYKLRDYQKKGDSSVPDEVSTFTSLVQRRAQADPI
ncbi:MAG: IS3 family transposase [Solobacterium sp.]|nr:IS3 family transposase [Solobacterium sp.]